MAEETPSATTNAPADQPVYAAAKTLGVRATDVTQIVLRLKEGLPNRAVLRLKERSGLSYEIHFVVQDEGQVRLEGKLSPRESEQLYRLTLLFEMAAALFEVDTTAARNWRNWLLTPNEALANQSPLQMAETEIGAREVEDLVGRLEHGVFV